MIIFLLVLVAQYFYWFWKTYPKPGEPPIVSGSLPLVGHGYMIFGNPRHWWNKFKELTHTCLNSGHAVYFLIGTQKFYVLTDPDDIYLVSNACLAKDTVFSALMRELIGPGLIFADVPLWKKHRKLILPGFNQQILDEYLIVFNDQARQLVKRLEVKVDNGPFDHSVYLNQIALETVCLTTMDVKLEEDEVVNYLKSFDKAVDNGIEKYQKLWLHFDFIYNRTKMKYDQENCINTVRETSSMILYRKITALNTYMSDKKHNNDVKSQDRRTPKRFLDLLLQSADSLTNQEIRDEVNGMIIAGTDTSANVLMFAFLLIASHPKVQDRVYAELNDIFKGTYRDVEKPDLTRLTYLEAVIKETLRYYVMAPFILRYINKEIKLKNCTLQPGNNCLISIYGVHRHPMWGDDSEEFRPERWLDRDSLPTNSNAFMAFSVGKRNCIGKAFAMMSMKTTLSHILRHYKLRGDHTDVKLKLDVLIKPISGHYISIEKREMRDV